MKKFVIKSITMRNFRGAKEVVTSFDPMVTTISGRNGSGKSRHFDAFLWCLFGKDMEDRKDFNVKTVGLDGKSQNEVNTEVELVADIDGSTNTLRRVLTEVWTKPKGQEERVFKGNSTECFWNDVPLKVSEFESRVQGIIDASLFKMLTNPSFFPSMKWQDQRAMLFQMAGTLSDYELASRKPEYAALLDKISGKSFAEYKAQLAAQKRKIKDELDGIQPRIDQTQKMMPEAMDWEAIKSQLETKQAEIADLETKMSDIVKANRAKYDAIKELQDKKHKLESEAANLVNAARLAFEAKQSEEGAGLRRAESAVRVLTGEIKSLTDELNGVKTRISRVSADIDDKRTQYGTESAKQYEGDGKCHHCQQALPSTMLETAKHDFAEAQKKRLEFTVTDGNSLKDTLATLKSQESDLEKKIVAEQDKLDILNAEVAKLKQEAPKDLESFNASEVPGCREIAKEIEAIQAEIDKATAEAKTDEVAPGLAEKKKALQDEMLTLVQHLNQKDVIAKYETEIKSLHEREKVLGQELSNCEKDEYTMSQFTKAKIEDAEQRINGMFSMTKFRLFEYTIDGNEVEVCKPMLDGVEYGTVNTAGKVAIGLDIIRALQRFHNAQFPIFCDGAESVNEFPQMENQMIYLRVTDETTLSVSTQNYQLTA
jgi:exonuclease SbcC